MSDEVAEPELLTKEQFSLIIEDIVQTKNVSFMEAVILYCEENMIEIEVAAKLLNNNVKEKVKSEAIDLNFLPKQGKLPGCED